MSTLGFTNLDTSPMQIGETTTQRELRERIEGRYTEDAIECSAAFARAVEDILGRTPLENQGKAILQAIRETERYAYMREGGIAYRIDLLNRTFTRDEN